ncbi:MAG TPA: RHS repeat-associated core domain-containing protein [Gemmatimonadaceae bacterium]|nr:RHS repeat-associated core domain-containing protein [Gemmatimonadaceae bacterium]
MPIDVASGNLHLDFDDARILGKVDLVWNRRYSGDLLSRPHGVLGSGWRNRYEATLTRHADAFEFVSPTGAVSVLADPDHRVERGLVVRQLSGFFEIFAQAGRFIVNTWSSTPGQVLRYAFIPGDLGQVLSLASMEDVAGNGLDMTRDAAARLVTVRQRREDRSLTLEYHDTGLLRSVALRARNGTTRLLAHYEYTDQGQLATAFDSLGYASRYEYDGQGRLSRQIAKDGAVVSFRYDTPGRCVSMRGLDGYDQKRLRFIDAARVTEVTDSYGATSRYQYLPTGQVVREWNPLGQETKTEYDTLGRMVATILPSGATTRQEYDENGNLIRVVDPLGGSTSITYNGGRQPVEFRDPMGGVWTRAYDARGYLVQAEDPLGGVSTWAYDHLGNKVTATSPSGATTRFTYRDDGTLHQIIEPSGATTSVLFDESGRPIMRVNPRGGVVQAEYDSRGATTTIRRPDGTVLRYVYDAAGNIVARDGGDGSITRFEWGTCHRLLRRIDPLGHTLTYEWGTEADRLLSVTNEAGERCEFSYDAAGRCVAETLFDGLLREFQYDADGRLAQSTAGGAEKLEFAYDLAGRLLRRKGSDGAAAQFEYDELGRLTAALNANCNVHYAYDALGNPIEERQDDVVIQNAYDADGRLVRRRSSLGFEAEYFTDVGGRHRRINLFGAHAFEFTYDGTGDEVSRTLPGGQRLEQDRDERGRVSRQFVSAGPDGSSVPNVRGYLYATLSRAYHYDPNNAPTRMVEGRNSDVTYAYDAAQQLISVSNGGGADREQFTYNPTGSLALVSSPRGDKEFHYDPGNRLRSSGSSHFEYDELGQRTAEWSGDTREPSRRFAWDSFRRLVSVDTDAGERWEYRYDALGRRIAKQSSRGIQRFVWCGNTILHRVTRGGAVESWLHDDDRLVPIAKVQAGNVYSVVTDQLGVPRELLDRDGSIVWAASFLAWGQVKTASNREVDCPFRFPGQWYDEETGLHYNRHRYFDPGVGQFVSQDPIGIAGGLNLYRYAPNPLNFVDLFGLTVCENRKKGEDFKNAVKEELEKAGFIVVEEVTIKVDTADGSKRTRVDLLVMDPNGNPVLIECKASATAPYTPNQTTAGIPSGEHNGPGTPPGSLAGPAEYRTDKGGIDKGTAVPSSAQVVTVRPGQPIPGTSATAPYP